MYICLYVYMYVCIDVYECMCIQVYDIYILMSMYTNIHICVHSIILYPLFSFYLLLNPS